ncbi:MAG: adenosine deaminase [Pseudomonadota bacterium]|uniref:adenosine deaminase n=1 Tax=unclassified Phenylobacterium TaxID=2640670 RepID=UPI0006FE9010|nr:MULTISPECIES: adenosine deaminase [unclassified Phenylobacterium]KRB51565.1 adenosine deaminase [Phenylobacterium sp. Root700]MBT9473440.1 adenosine deaminase [Phenylobacterium sp.]
MDQLTDFIRGLPKAELHLHIEGSLEPEQMFEFARRNGVELPFADVEAVRAAYAFSNLQDFLDIYYQGARVLLTQQDFHDLAMAYFRRIAADGARHAEIFFDPQTHTERGVPFAVVADGLLAAMAQAEAELEVTSKLILCFLRHLSEEDAFETLKQAEPYLDRIVGVGLDSSEVGHPPAKFARVFAAARAKGLKTVAHAGEEGPPDYVYQALDMLEVDRIDHGNRALEDDALTERLAREGMTLTVCPLSNLKLCVVDDLTAHPLRKMLGLGLRATINSDDPAYFGGYLGQNWVETAQALDLSRDELVTLARNSFTGSFLGPDEIAAHLAQIDRYVASAA